jgi:hypothetical protein
VTSAPRANDAEPLSNGIHETRRCGVRSLLGHRSTCSMSIKAAASRRRTNGHLTPRIRGFATTPPVPMSFVMNSRDWRNIALVLLLPVAAVIGYVVGVGQPTRPQHAGWFLAAALLVSGGVLGLRTLLLLVAGCIACYISAEAHSLCRYECNAGILLLTFIPVLFSVPVVAGALAGRLFRRFL